MIYIKRVVAADLTRQIGLNNDAALSFFDYVPETTTPEKDLSFTYIKDGENYFGTIKKKGNSTTITGGVSSLVRKECIKDDLLVFVLNSEGSYNLSIVKKSDADYDHYNSILNKFGEWSRSIKTHTHLLIDFESDELDEKKEINEDVFLESYEYSYISAIKTKPFLILGGFSGTGKSLHVKMLAFATCPCDGVLDVSSTSPGNYLLLSVKPNWHDATDITGFRSSVNRNYYVTDFMRFLIKAKQYEEQKVPFFVCLDEMNLAPVEEYFADFLSVIESRTRCKDGKIVTDAIVPASVFKDGGYADDFNIFMEIGLEPVDPTWKADDINALPEEKKMQAFIRQDIVEELKRNGLTIPSNVVIIGTVNMDDTTNSFSRKVIDRAMTFETVVGIFSEKYFNSDIALNYTKKPCKGEMFLSDEVRATEMIEKGRFDLSKNDKDQILSFINGINEDLKGTPFKISYRILNETILLYRSKQEIKKIIEEDGGFEDGIEFKTDLNSIFDDILMQKVLPRIEGDYEKCNTCLVNLAKRSGENDWKRSAEKIEFMVKRFGKDKSGFTSFWN